MPPSFNLIDGQAPFAGELKDAGYATDPGKINEILGTDALARVVTEAELTTDIQYRGLELTTGQYVSLGRDELRNLANYGIVIPHFQMIWGNNQAGEKSLYTAVEKIDGTELLAAINSDKSDDLSGQLGQLYTHLATYYADKLATGGYYLDDLKNSHFMWGKTSEDDAQKIYLVDLDARVSKFDKNDPESDSAQEFYSRLGFFSHMLVEAEAHGAPVQTEARNTLMQAIAANPLPQSADKIVQKIQNNLAKE